jgi:thioredoxin reductase (NADPH)
MSRYLIDRIEATPNITLHPNTELVDLHGEPASGLNGATWRDRLSGARHDCPARNLFLFIGAVPETEWLRNCNVGLDKDGFVLTGPQARGGFPARPAGTLEASVPGVFAVGDVRAGSVKRVGGAIGEGAAVVALIHERLASTETVA